MSNIWSRLINLAGNITGILPVVNGGTGVATSTGTTNAVLSNGPTLVAPVLGTPASGNLSNCTSYPAAGSSTAGTITAEVACTTYSPSATNMANLGTVSFNTVKYFRLGTMIVVQGSATITPTLGTNTKTTFRMTLPVAPSSNFTNDSWADCNGALILSGAITSDSTGNFRAYNSGSTNEAICDFTAKTTSALNFSIQFIYRST